MYQNNTGTNFAIQIKKNCVMLSIRTNNTKSTIYILCLNHQIATEHYISKESKDWVSELKDRITKEAYKKNDMTVCTYLTGLT